MSETSSVRILVVEDDRATSEALCSELRGRGHLPVASQSVAEGLEQLKQADFEVGLLDLTLPDGSGIDLLQQVASDDLGVEVILLAGDTSVPSAIEAMKQGAYDYVTKPASMDKLEVLVAKAAEKARLRRENLTLRARLQHLDAQPGLLTEDASMRDLIVTMERVASAEIPVLVQGESGTGKEMVARAIHRMSPRAAQGFVALHCGAVPENLIESELFGHEKGAFAGALVRKPGLLEVANRGVLFLDEVGEISPAVQPKLLRALETGEFFRVGGTRPVRTDVRLVSASTRNLRTEMQSGGFREDLYYKLNGVTLKLPALRERPADVPLLARHFVDRYAGRKKLTPRALEALQRYSWPGNVRELEMLIQRAAALVPREVIDAEDLPLDVRDQGWRSAPSRTGLSLAEMEKEYIETVLRQHDGHRGKTARALGIDPKTLYNKLGPERPRKKVVAS
jgi:DNA-binding NtrC family response regulator